MCLPLCEGRRGRPANLILSLSWASAVYSTRVLVRNAEAGRSMTVRASQGSAGERRPDKTELSLRTSVIKIIIDVYHIPLYLQAHNLDIKNQWIQIQTAGGGQIHNMEERAKELTEGGLDRWLPGLYLDS